MGGGRAEICISILSKKQRLPKRGDKETQRERKERERREREKERESEREREDVGVGECKEN